MKRIFLVGTGPSLNVTPLDELVGEDSASLNRIHLIYPRTKWRPTYYYSVDYNVHNTGWKEAIDANLGVAKHLFLLSDWRYGLPKDHINAEDFPPEKALGDLPNTTWIPRCELHRSYSASNPKGMQAWHFPQVCTTLNGMSGLIQLSVQMGYEEIYLVGVDLGWQFDYTKNHFDPHYADCYAPKRDFEIAYWIQNDIYNSIHTYKIAKKECEARGVKIFNATIGGELEIFQRVDLLSTLRKGKHEQN